MTYFLWFIGGVVGLAVAYDLCWWLREAIHPFEHRDVPLEDLQTHINQILRRGYNRSQMLIKDEGTGKSIRFMKTYKQGEEGIGFVLIACDITREHPLLPQFKKELTELGFRATSEGLPLRAFRENLGCECPAEAAQAARAAETVLTKFYALSRNAKFRVRVKGPISRGDISITGQTSRQERVAALDPDLQRSCTPYTWYHSSRKKPEHKTLAHRLGSSLGMLVRWLFPIRPRRPGDDLRK